MRMASPKIIVVGAGPEGLSAAMLLAAKGYAVEVLEKQPVAAALRPSGSFRPESTFLNMPHILEELFAEAGRSVHDYVRLAAVKTFYRLLFGGSPFYVYKDKGQMIREITQMFPGNERGYREFMRRETASPITSMTNG
ncbi:phytoene dehydrogenase-like protein [Paenibacillus mucilaginosus]|uniref:phytoene desaturase family protein n=1 Tax=Paenibacillus mucilaginosus TaxID=61624 RepID=UPI003D19C9D5